jgi:hypothetical protein
MQIPIAISRLRRLVTLDLSNNYFLKTPLLKLENPNLNMLVQNLSELIKLHLDGVSISVQANEWCQVLIIIFIAKSARSLSIICLDGNNLNTSISSRFLCRLYKFDVLAVLQSCMTMFQKKSSRYQNFNILI